MPENSTERDRNSTGIRIKYARNLLIFSWCRGIASDSLVISELRLSALRAYSNEDEDED